MAFRADTQAFAEVAYQDPAKPERWWRASVNKTNDGWKVRFGNSKDQPPVIPGGTFKNGKALIKFLREKAEEKMGKGVKPFLDTLHKLKGKTPQSVVPDCFSPVLTDLLAFGGRGLPECVACPYRSKCREPSAQPETIPTEEAVEPDEIFLARLQSKIKERWGDK